VIRFPRDPHLPLLPADESLRGYAAMLRKRLTQLFTEVRLTTADIQSPPVVLMVRSATQSLSAGVAPKVQFEAAPYDTRGYADLTNYRYTPLETGYYRVSWGLLFGTASNPDNGCVASLYVNGSAVRGDKAINPTTTDTISAGGSACVYLNGSSDYIEVYALSVQACSVVANAPFNFLAAELIGADAIA
jgi:hypothetical protein